MAFDRNTPFTSWEDILNAATGGDSSIGNMWSSASFDPSIHYYKTFSFNNGGTSDGSANVQVIDLATQFVGVSGVAAQCMNGATAYSASVPRTLSGFLVGSVLWLRVENTVGAALPSTSVPYSVTIHGYAAP